MSEPYEGQREPSCIHSEGMQPASMCMECRVAPWFTTWLEDARKAGLLLPTFITELPMFLYCATVDDLPAGLDESHRGAMCYVVQSQKWYYYDGRIWAKVRVLRRGLIQVDEEDIEAW